MQISEKPLKIITEFRKKMQGRPCIVFLGGYPYKSRLGDGYFQRVASISQNLSDFLQIFIDRENIPHSSGWLDCPQPSVLSISIRHNWLARITAIIVVILSKRLYIHSIYPLKFLLFLLRLPKVLKVLDFHGAVPEELSLMGDVETSKNMGKLEKYAVHKADYFVFVSEAMHKHFSTKYRVSFDSKYVIIPIVANLTSSIPQKPPLTDQPTVVYAGGLQVWQKISEIVDTISKTIGDYQYKIFTTQTNEIRAFLSDEGVQQENIEIANKPHRELLNIYKDCHFGFLLRDDHVINRVACPTKLIEYLAFGVLPILYNARIGDFSEMGIKYISLGDFCNKNLPDTTHMKAMIQHNFDLYQSLLLLQQKGLQLLKKYLLENS